MPAAPSEGLLDAYRIDLCDNELSFRSLQREWNGLLDRATRKSVFLKHQWMHTWWTLYGARRSGSRLFILTARDAENRLVGVLPLYLECWGWGPFRLRVARLLGTTDQAPEHLDIIVDNRQSDHVLAALLENLAARRHEYDALQFTDLWHEALLLSSLSRWSRMHGGLHRSFLGSICPYLRTSGDFESLLQSLPAKHRHDFHRQTRRLIDGQHAVFEVAVTPEAAKNGLEALFVLHQQRWVGKEGKSQFDKELSRAFHRRLAVALAEDGAVRLYMLKCEGRTIAVFYVFCFNRRLLGYQAGLDPAFKSYSLGTLVLGKMIADCFSQDFQEFDFLRGEESYKFKWTQLTRPTLVCEVALTMPAKMYFLLRHSSRNLKKRIRRLLAKWYPAEN